MSRSKRAKRRLRNQKPNQQVVAAPQQPTSGASMPASRLVCSPCVASTTTADLFTEAKQASAATQKMTQLFMRYIHFRIKWKKFGLLAFVGALLMVVFEIEFVQHVAMFVLVEHILTKAGAGAFSIIKDEAVAAVDG